MPKKKIKKSVKDNLAEKINFVSTRRINEFIVKSWNGNRYYAKMEFANQELFQTAAGNNAGIAS